MKKSIILFVFSLLLTKLFAQYPPAAGQIGSTAIFKDSSVFIEWAAMCNVTRGFVDISDTAFEDPDYPGTNKASFGDSSAALGLADNNTVSLGDGGSAALTFSHPVSNGQGFDFAVFENSFDDFFLELAFVEVSSDGVHFVRFPSTSLTQTATQIASFGILDATKIYNLAGKYKVFYGTPFDLSDLQDSTGIDLGNITHIRIVDVIGSISESYASFDSQEHIINDPFPTPFWTSGYDLDAVGVIHNTTNTGICEEEKLNQSVKIYPNPTSDFMNISVSNSDKNKIQLLDFAGRIIKEENFENNIKIDVKELPIGIYFAKICNENRKYFIGKVIINKN